MSVTKGRKYWVGFDLGGTKMLAGVFDGDFKLLATARQKTKGDTGATAGLKRMAELIREALEEAKITPAQLGGIGFGCPGPLDLNKGVLLDTPNLGWKNVPLRKAFEKEFKRPVAVANDVDAGTFGEYMRGAARGSRSVLGVFPGTGIGGGFVYEGRLIRGRTQSCMEIGHVKVQAQGRLCGCGRRGCLEAVASRLAISADAAAAVYRGEAPALAKLAGTDLAKIRSGTLAESIRKGDKAVENIVRQAAILIGRAIADTINLLAPDTVVLGGGLVEAIPDIFLGECRRVTEAQVMDAFEGTFKIVAARLGDTATVTGAAALAAQEAGA